VTVYRELGEVPEYPKEQEPMNENERDTKIATILCVAGVVAFALGLSTCAAVNFHADSATVRAHEEDAKRAKSEADKSMFDHMQVKP